MMTAALSCYTGLTAGYLWRRGCLSFVFGTLHHHCGSADNTRGGLVERTKDGQGPKLTGSEVDTHTHLHLYTRTDAQTQTSGHTHTHGQTPSPSSRHLIWVPAISGKNAALGHTPPPALRHCLPLLPLSLRPRLSHQPSAVSLWC